MTPETDQRDAFEAFKTGAMLAGNNAWAKARPHFLDAFKLHPEQIRYALYLGGAMWESGSQPEAVELWSLFADRDPAIRLLQYTPNVDAMTQRVSRVADSQIRMTLSTLHTEVLAKQKNPGRMANSRWPQTHIAPTDYPEAGPRPYMFYAPDLPQTSIFDRSDVPWTQELESAAADIRAEFLALSDAKVKGKPYVHLESAMSAEWDVLKGQDKWTSIHLYEDGQAKAAAAHCPKTCAALKGLPLVLHNGNPMEVFFSVLEPETHIPAHFGLANSRLTVHLPLIIPEGCTIRVGDTTHTWREDETFLFDDSHNHEAWNNSKDPRIVLIFEAWRPDMTKGEISAVEASFKARQAWLDGRRVPK